MECRVGLPNDNQPRWRCFICSQLNLWDNNECKRCQEPMTESQKIENKLKMKSFQSTNRNPTNGTNTTTKSTFNTNGIPSCSNINITSYIFKLRSHMYT